ncbi:hypothetical protein E0H39_35205 [Rhizobium leguminosarum bv. viciae]|jgi:hypothetical protein|uniref:Transmembrane protein n=2 Tax=Rhizobium TaxID=379 RepID=A0A7G6RIE6_RHILV|nr:hypothetical protein CHR56_04815 [Rhizobium leguminosarum bv. viciae]OOO49360.1 hypothetical protein BS629_14720 [Rhizobium leguminosarum bv. viciae USDA 2370]RWX23637.1 hypothetical protein EHH54_37910 [Rhizobium leguminosarum]NKJ83908.1 hypothetical protein [Rhizobium leguminosarum bv. viciae]NKK18548.1 hypothetical protein [Rhizobium leguminosarum bv. viciae]
MPGVMVDARKRSERMIWIYSVIGVLSGALLIGLAIWVGMSPSLSDRKSWLPEPSGNSVEPNDSSIAGSGSDLA